MVVMLNPLFSSCCKLGKRAAGKFERARVLNALASVKWITWTPIPSADLEFSLKDPPPKKEPELVTRPDPLHETDTVCVGPRVDSVNAQVSLQPKQSPAAWLDELGGPGTHLAVVRAHCFVRSRLNIQPES